MMLEIAAARQGFEDGTISGIGFVRSPSSIADGPINSMRQAVLRNVMTTGRLDVIREQWIIEK